MSEVKYHISPKTGNPNQCRATVKPCPLGVGEPHYSSKEEARAAVEAENSEKTLATLKKKTKVEQNLGVRTLTEYLEVVKEREKLNNEKVRLIMNENNGKTPELTAEERSKKIKELKAEVEKIHKKETELLKQIRELPWNTEDALDYNPEEIVSLDLSFDEVKSGELNYWSETKQFEYNKEVVKELKRASEIWLSRLSTAEIKAVHLYTSSSANYDFAIEDMEELGIKEPDIVTHLHSALAKAPKISTPITLYSGLSQRGFYNYIDSLETEDSSLELNRASSFTLNFRIATLHADPDIKTYARYTTDKIASTAALSIFDEELEVLLPPGINKLQPTRKVSHRLENEPKREYFVIDFERVETE